MNPTNTFSVYCFNHPFCCGVFLLGEDSIQQLLPVRKCSNIMKYRDVVRYKLLLFADLRVRVLSSSLSTVSSFLFVDD